MNIKGQSPPDKFRILEDLFYEFFIEILPEQRKVCAVHLEFSLSVAKFQPPRQLTAIRMQAQLIGRGALKGVQIEGSFIGLQVEIGNFPVSTVAFVAWMVGKIRAECRNVVSDSLGGNVYPL